MQTKETRALPQSDDALSDDLLEVVAGGTKCSSKSKCAPAPKCDPGPGTPIPN